jgi:hypothetical protein
MMDLVGIDRKKYDCADFEELRRVGGNFEA